MIEKKLGRVGLVGRFKPLHLGAVMLLESACEKSDQVIIGVGSANKYNIRNPFTASETKNMIDLVLKERFRNYEIRLIDDTSGINGVCNDKQWVKNMLDSYGVLDGFITGNPYVKSLLEPHYKIIDPSELIDTMEDVNSTTVRVEMAMLGDWKRYVHPKVAEYIAKNRLDTRFRQEFSLKTLEEYAKTPDYTKKKGLESEKMSIFVE